MSKSLNTRTGIGSDIVTRVCANLLQPLPLSCHGDKITLIKKERMSFRPYLLQSPGFYSSDDQGEQIKDYLQDPSLWWDPLPQPFRMIDSLLQEILQNAWNKIEERAKVKKESRKTIKLTEEATLISSIPEPKTLQYLQTGDREYIFGGGGLSGLHCIQFKPMRIQATYDTPGIVSSISCQDMSNEMLVTAIGMEEKGGQLVLVLQDLQFKEICEVLDTLIELHALI